MFNEKLTLQALAFDALKLSFVGKRKPDFFSPHSKPNENIVILSPLLSEHMWRWNNNRSCQKGEKKGASENLSNLIIRMCTLTKGSTRRKIRWNVTPFTAHCRLRLGFCANSLSKLPRFGLAKEYFYGVTQHNHRISNRLGLCAEKCPFRDDVAALPSNAHQKSSSDEQHFLVSQTTLTHTHTMENKQLHGKTRHNQWVTSRFNLKGRVTREKLKGQATRKRFLRKRSKFWQIRRWWRWGLTRVNLRICATPSTMIIITLFIHETPWNFALAGGREGGDEIT